VNADLGRTQEHLRRLDVGTAALRDEVLRRMILLDRIGRGGATRLVLTSRDPAEAASAPRWSAGWSAPTPSWPSATRR